MTQQQLLLRAMATCLERRLLLRLTCMLLGEGWYPIWHSKHTGNYVMLQMCYFVKCNTAYSRMAAGKRVCGTAAGLTVPSSCCVCGVQGS
jgi:hypothetical protein